MGLKFRIAGAKPTQKKHVISGRGSLTRFFEVRD